MTPEVHGCEDTLADEQVSDGIRNPHPGVMFTVRNS